MLSVSIGYCECLDDGHDDREDHTHQRCCACDLEACTGDCCPAARHGEYIGREQWLHDVCKAAYAAENEPTLEGSR